jgi:3-oxoacyl-[acyl-carrier protein] reductase
MINLKDKVTLITGASRGIGHAAAVMFAECGSHVVVNYRADSTKAQETAHEVESHGVRALLAQADVSDKEQVDRMVEQTIKEFGRLDVLVNNAGIWEHNPIDSLQPERLKRTIDINIYGTYYPIMAAAPVMIRQKSGCIINISSTAGQRGEAFHSPYGTSKGAVISLTKSLATELAMHNIRVNCVAPGWVETDMSHDSLIGPDREKILGLIPLGRAGDPRELAGPIVFLASDLATFITGEILNVNGGAVLCG